MTNFFRSLSRPAMVSLLLLPLSNTVFADQSAVLSAVQAALPQYEVESTELHDGAGLYVVVLKDGPTLHVTQDGKYFVAGDLYRIDNTALENETEKAKLAKVEALPESQMIVYKAKNEKAHITVFTDVDCGYCRMLHKEVPKLNDAGVTVRYLAYPRAGIGSEAYRKMVSVWCSADPQDWLTKVKLGAEIPENKCVNPVADQYKLGNEVGVRGTPSIVLDNGAFLPGYLPAAELVKHLGL
ncbi:thioredoxin fold domain-containing protein [Marinomonas sp. M1K-6]|uniref:Thiol:disulfide interchange protein n=1 Tax=Marinomonas profundi TaxID=2726122 RepID=A0A847R6J5_9GAMM|nr:thioredoxin fold domain-containing protein [Marinomonas profundi]NLQ18113.1 thioredoxin fold domain-containing protein [Marinomonas profundi]UDV04103.1 thioredoxin fold domain-containing protein [Marinomonas profundi]